MSNLAMMMGLGSGAGGVAVADVFSTYLYDGNSSSQTITNGIDLAGEGGLLWIKKRSGTSSHFLFGSDRSANNTALLSNTTLAYYGTSYSVSHSSTGFDISSTTSGDVNESGQNYVSWTFRKAPKFFDVVTYTGTGSAQTISHNLGSVPGCIIVKCTSNARDWYVYHRGSNNGTNPEQYKLNLNSTAAAATEADAWNNTAPTSSVFTVGSVGNVNGSGFTYVAYLFAHNEDLIQCGSFSGNDATVNVDLGWQPQFIIVKNSNNTMNWHMYDNERGAGAYLLADSSGQEFTDSSPDIVFNSTGFDASGNFGIGGRDYIYIANKAED